MYGISRNGQQSAARLDIQKFLDLLIFVNKTNMDESMKTMTFYVIE